MDNEVEIRISDKFISRGGFGQARKQVGEVDGDVKNLGKSVDGLAADFDRAGTEAGTRLRRSISQGLDGIDSDVRQAGHSADSLARDFDQAGTEAGNRLRRSLDRELDNLDSGAQRAGHQVGNSFSEGVSEGVHSGGGGISSALEDMLGGLSKGGAIAAAGAAAGTFFSNGLQQALAKDSAKGQLKAEFGLSEADAKSAGTTAGKVYSDGFGESVGETSAAVGKVRASFKGLSSEGSNSLESISKGALGVSQVFGQDVNEVIRATSSILKNGLAPDAKTALDIVTTGFQQGLDSGGDFLDTVIEYGPYFKQLGLSAQDGLGLVSQFLQAGARDADYAADAIKEFGIRSIDGSKPVVQAFKDLGFNAEEMAAKIAAGGPSAKEAFGQVITALQGIEDPIARNNAGVALFGTQWEDTVRAILPNIDLTKTGFENIAGATDKMNKSISETDTSNLDKLGRKANDVAEAIAGAGIEWFKLKTQGPEALLPPEAVKQMDDFKRVQQENNDLLAKRKGLTDEATTSQNGFAGALEAANIQAERGTTPFNELSNSSSALFASTSDLVKGNEKLAEAQGNTISASRSNLAAFISLGDGGYYMADSLVQAVTGLNDTQLAATGTTAAIDETGNAVITLPGGKTIQIDAETLAADNNLSGVVNRLATITSKTVTITVQELYAGSRASSTGWGVGGQAHGGNVGAYGMAGVGMAASGGARGNMTLVGEQGPELVRLPFGSTVLPNGQTRSMMDGGGGGGAQRVVLEWAPSAGDHSIMSALKNNIRVRGGDPRVLGP